MPRTGRVVIPGCPHHVTQRGNNRQDVFFVDGDREFYLDLLGRQCRLHGVRIVAYCLMGNHVHLVAIPRQADSLARALGRTHFVYTQYFNKLHGRSGHLWQNRFYSCGLDEEHFRAAAVYVERNPVRAGLVRRAWRYEWSSAAAHVHGRDPRGLLDMARWRKSAGGVDWREALKRQEDKATLESMRRCTRTGRPLGSDRFISKLEVLLRRRLRPLPGGRPRKRADERREKTR